MTQVEALKKARELIARPYGWTKGRFKRTYPKRGTQYCLLGAVRQISGYKRTDEPHKPTMQNLEIRLEQCIYKNYGIHGVATFNDAQGRKKKDVLKVLDCAIKSAEAAGL